VRRRAALAAALLSGLLAIAGTGLAQTPPAADPTDLLNALLGSLMGFRAIGEAELRSDVAAAGGIPFLSEVPLDYMTREEMARYFRELVDEEYPPQRAAADARALRAFDLLPGKADLRGLRIALLRDNVIGFYDERPGRRRLYAVSPDRTLTPANQLILAHELRHALQDQHVPIHERFSPEISDFDDRPLALLCLLEGDATLVMERFLLGRLGRSEGTLESAAGLVLPADAVAGVPEVLRDQLVQPYVAGLAFARRVQSHGGWDGMREAWGRPPRSTEQVLHAEKYFANEEPRPVSIPYAPPGGRQLSEGVLGELLIRTLVGAGGPSAAAGWGGDLWRVYDVKSRTLLLWRSVWDDPAEAREFHDALRIRFARRHGPASVRRGFTLYSGEGWTWAVGEWGGTIALVASDDRKLLAAALDAAGSES
jgi:hypothetical protein